MEHPNLEDPFSFPQATPPSFMANVPSIPKKIDFSTFWNNDGFRIMLWWLMFDAMPFVQIKWNKENEFSYLILYSYKYKTDWYQSKQKYN